MNEKKNKSKDINIRYKLIDVKKNNYFENDIENQDLLQKISKTSIPFKLNLFTTIDNTKGIIELILKIIFYIENNKTSTNNKKVELLGIKTSHKFKIKEFEKLFPSKEKVNYLIPIDLMATLLNIAISDTRGMLIILNSNEYYKKIMLPVINPYNIIEKGKKK